MGLFSIKLPRCPKCGAETKRTYAAFPFPQFACPNCIARNNADRLQKNEIEELKARIKALEQK